MATLKFRPPQFSEESVWAPCWLQQVKANPFNEQRTVSSTPYEKAAMATCESEVQEQKDPNFSTSEMIFNSFHLFLSEQDGLQNSYTSPSENVLHLCLHLSADDNPQRCPSQPMNQSQVLMESSDVISKPLLQAEAVEHVIPECLINVKSNSSNFKDKHIVRYPKVDDIKDAVELSIAASEALAIHELIKSESTAKVLPSEALLEVSLRVKKARLEMSKDFVHTQQTEQACQSDSLSDLDDFLMADVYDDVGLPQHTIKDQYTTGTVMSQVQDTRVFESHSGSGNRFGSVDIKIQETNSEIYSDFHQLEKKSRADIQLAKGFLSYSANYDKPDQISDNLVLAPNLCDISELGNLMFSELAKKKSDVATTSQNCGFQIHHDPGNSSQHIDKSSALEKEQTVSLKRFKSRWLGGWAGELDVTEKVQQCKKKTIPQPFIEETSFISESADNPPDEHSSVQKSETQHKIVLQSSLPVNSQIDKIGNEMLLCQDIVGSSLSLVDPLCSFVPCSISSENLCFPHGKTLNEAANGAKQFFSDFPDFKLDNLGRTIDCKVDISHQCENKSFLADSEDLGNPIFREVTSLKSYSVLFPNHSSIYCSGRLHNNHKNQLQCELRLLPIRPDTAWTRIPFQTHLRESPLQSLSSFDKMENRETSDKLNQTSEQTKKKMNRSASVERQNLLVDSAPFLSRRTIRQMKIDKCSKKTFSIPAEKDPEGVNNVHLLRNFQKTPSNGGTSQKTGVLNRKRVHFAESEIQVQEDKDLHKLHPSDKYCSDKNNKRNKCSNQGVNPQIHSCNACLVKRCDRIEKRLIFHGLDFLLTGFSIEKEQDTEELIRKHGGCTLLDIPVDASRKKSSKCSCDKLPIILCLKKLRSIKFLYGCAVNALILHVDWLTDSIAACSVLPPGKYMIIPNQAEWGKSSKRQSHGKRKFIFERVGIMLDGKQSFCTNLAKIFKHGGGQVFKNLQQLVKCVNNEKLSVGFIVAQDTGKVSRHLKQCALEQGISLLPANWVIKSLHLGKLLPVARENRSFLPTLKFPKAPIDAEMSQQA